MRQISMNDHDIIVYHALDMNKPLKFLKEILKDDTGDYDFLKWKIKEFLKDYPIEVQNEE
jgi:hypothetical protein